MLCEDLFIVTEMRSVLLQELIEKLVKDICTYLRYVHLHYMYRYTFRNINASLNEHMGL